MPGLTQSWEAGSPALVRTSGFHSRSEYVLQAHRQPAASINHLLYRMRDLDHRPISTSEFYRSVLRSRESVQAEILQNCLTKVLGRSWQANPAKSGVRGVRPADWDPSC